MTKGLLKFITCGSVDDGKSTLIGHMLYDAKLLYADQKRALELDSRVGSRGGAIDYSLLLDGLMAEREQGITIDVAYRYFTTEKRSFIVADTPGHEEYTRNMAVGASFAELAVILIDATKGILTQTMRHARICALMGIQYFVFAVNKMDLVGYDRETFQKIEKEIRKLAIDLDLESIKVIPVSATEGDNVTNPSMSMKWYSGDTLLSYLENVNTEEKLAGRGFFMPVQRVCRPDYTYRGFQGQIEEGSISEGNEINILPGNERAAVKKILAAGIPVEQAFAGQPVSIQLDREVDVSRGCVFERGSDLQRSGMFTATILWMDATGLSGGMHFYLKLGTKMLPAEVMKIKYKTDINTGEHLSACELHKNEIASCDICLPEKIVMTPFKDHRSLGSFILINRVTNMTSACGVIEHTLRRSDNLHEQQADITREIRAAHMGQRPCTIWFTGLSGSGKSAIANEVEKRLSAMNFYTMLLDGDNIRRGLNKNLGFTPEDRIENIRRIAEVSKLMNDAGLIVLTAFISPYEADRENARQIIGEEHFIEIYVSTPLEECEKRDAFGLYKKARAGEIPNFTGISGPFETPQKPDVVIDTTNMRAEEAADRVMQKIEERLSGKESK